MHNAVLDTNVIVSGLLSANGNSAQIINAFKERKFCIVYNDEILAEYRDVLNREKFGLNVKDIEDLIAEICRIGLPVMQIVSDVSFTDEDDRVFYDIAQSSEAFLVTGNTKHFPSESFILTPAEFIKTLNEET